MFYQILEDLLNSELKIATESDLVTIDHYLATLNAKQALKISAWKISNITKVTQEAILEVLLKASSLGLLTVKYEIIHPSTKIALKSYDKPEDIPLEINCHEIGIDGENFNVSEENIYLIFRLNEIKEIDSKKKNFTALPLTNLPAQKPTNNTSPLEAFTIHDVNNNEFLSQLLKLTQTLADKIPSQQTEKKTFLTKTLDLISENAIKSIFTGVLIILGFIVNLTGLDKTIKDLLVILFK